MMKRRTFLGASASLLGVLPALADKVPPAKPIRIGQIGVGHAHANKLAVYRRSADYEVVGVVEPDAELRKRAATQDPYRGVRWMTQAELLGDPTVQAVLVETPVRDLLSTAEACINAGKHVHLDKPAGSSLPQFERLLQAAQKRNLLVQMGYMYRYSPAVLMLRDLLKQNALGEIYEVHALMSKVVGAEDRRRLAEFSGGIQFELGCHVLDLVIAILGQPKQVASYLRHSSNVDDGLIDNALAVLQYPKAIATVKASAIEVDGGDRRHLVVCGTEGTFHVQPLDNPAVRVTFARATGPYKKGYQTISFGKYERYVGDAADMAKILRGEKVSDFSYEHDRIVQATLLQASGMPTDR